MRLRLLNKIIKSELPIQGNFRDVRLRQKMSDAYDAMYPNLLNVRVKNRRNITRDLRNAVSEVLSALYAEAPNVTGYGMKFGIQYEIVSKNEAVVIIGGSFAPYMVHLAYPIGPNGVYSKWIDWIDKAYANMDLEDNVDVSEPNIDFGETIITITVDDYE